jgi:lipopolysaccharide transport system permease protein
MDPATINDAKVRVHPRPVPWRELLLPWRVLAHFFAHRQLAWQFMRREVLGRYRGSFLGLLWSFITPLLMLTIYSVVFGLVFETRYEADGSETGMMYALALFCSLNFFQFFAEALNRAPRLMLDHPSFVTRVVFPLEVFGVAAVSAASVHLVISMSLLVAAALATGVGIPPTAPYLLLLLVPLLMLSLGITWLLSSAGLFVRDIQALTQPLTTVLMFVSAVFYPLSRVPENLRGWFLLNPVALLVEQSRRVMVQGHALDWPTWGLLMAVSLIVFHLGYSFFMRTKHLFADRI